VNQSSTVQVYRIPIDEVSMSRNARSSRVRKSNPAEWKSNHDISTFTKTCTRRQMLEGPFGHNTARKALLGFV